MKSAISLPLKRCAVIALAILLAACAVPGKRVPAGHAQTGSPMLAWPLAELAATTERRLLLRAGDQPVGVIQTDYLRAAWTTALRLLQRFEGERPELLVTEGSLPNAFVFAQDGVTRMAINVALVNLLGDDDAAWAALIGHELAHLKLRHRDARSERQATGEAVTSFVGLTFWLLGFPLGDALAGSASTIVERGYSRDDEREADRTGVMYMIAAGYDPQGAVRLQEKLAAAGGGGRTLPFLSTHPSSSERVEAMRTLVRQLAGDDPSQPK